MKVLNNRTVVHWAVKMDLLGEGEDSLKDVDAAVHRVPTAFVKSLEELVAEDAYLRFGDFALKHYSSRPQCLEKLGIELAEIKKGFDRIARRQNSSDRSIGELAAEEGIIAQNDISAIEEARYGYYRRQKPLKLMLKERYEVLMRRALSKRVTVTVVALCLLATALYLVV